MAGDIESIIDESGRIIAAWEILGTPGGRPEDNLRIIREHLVKLGELRHLHPRYAGQLEDLALRYGAMSVKIRSRAN